jgi:hypothetical protein
MTEPTPLPIAECRLDLPGLHAQRERYRAIGRHLAGIERHPGRLEARFTPDLDTALVCEAIHVERGCCPFFEFRHEPAEHRLSITVDDPARDPALDAVQFALTSS